MRTKITSLIIFISIYFIILYSCTQKKIIHEQILEKPAYHLKNYSFDPDSSIESRCTKIPEIVLENLKRVDQRKDYSNYSISEDERKNVTDSIKKLPKLHKEVLQERLVGIYFVKNFLGSGYTDWILDENKNVYTYVVFNPGVLKNDISKWISIKENTCFIKNSPDISIKIDCGTDFTGLLYILIHETTHVVDYVKNITPYVEKDLKEVLGIKIDENDFTKGIWKDYSTPIEKYDYKSRKDVTFYGFGSGPKINISDSMEVYKQLSTTPFVSIYGSIIWAEDLAELVTFYHLTQKLHQPYKINVYNKNDIIHTYEPMKSEKVKKRYDIIQKFYE